VLVEQPDVRVDGGDVSIQVGQFSPDRIGGRICVELALTYDNLEQRSSAVILVAVRFNCVLVGPDHDLLLRLWGQ
jgi:hypothetical protein